MNTFSISDPRKRGLDGTEYNPVMVFDPSKQKKTAESPAKMGLTVNPADGINTTAGAGYYANRSLPSSNRPEQHGLAAAPDQRPPAAEPAKPLLSPQTTPELTTSPMTKGLSLSFDRRQPAGGLVANNSVSDFSPGSRNETTALNQAGLNVGPAPLTGYSAMRNGLTGGQAEQLGTISNRGIAGLTYGQQVERAAQVNEGAQRDLMRLSPREQAAAETANNKNFGSFIRGGAAGDLAGYESRKNVIAGQLSDNQAQKIAGIKEQGDRYVANQSVAAHKYAADQSLAAHQYTADAGITKASQTALGKQQEQQQQDYAGRVKGLVSGWEKLNLPTQIVPKLNYYAQLHAQAEDPKGNVFLMAPNRQGGMYVALPKVYEPHYQNLLKSGLSHNDAAARIYAIANKNGHTIDVPDLARYATRKEAMEG